MLAAHTQKVAPSMCLVLKLYYVGNHGNHDVKNSPVTMAAIFSVPAVLSMC